MIRIDLNNYPDTTGPCRICRMLLREGKAERYDMIEFFRGETPIFKEPRQVGVWAQYSVSEPVNRSVHFTKHKEFPSEGF